MDRLALRRIIDQHFNESELRDLCFELGIDYEHLEGNSKAGKVRSLLLYFERRKALERLAETVVRLRPEVQAELDASLTDATGHGDFTSRPAWLEVGLPTGRRSWLVLVGAALLVIGTTVTLILWRGEIGATDTPTPGDDVVGMQSVPAGSFLMGSDEGAADTQPERTVYLDAFWIDTFEVTNASYHQYVEDTNHRAPDHWPDGNYPTGQEDHPVLGVTWHDAQQYCEWRGGMRLPTEAEWEKAARGSDGRRWPWGNDAGEGWANTAEAGIGTTVPVGTYLKDVSPYGVVDMAGNAQEWVLDWYQDDYYTVAMDENPPSPLPGEFRVVRGGTFWLDLTQAMTYTRLGIFPPEYPPPVSLEINIPSSTIGFRCVCISCG